jgi:signal peptidase II
MDKNKYKISFGKISIIMVAVAAILLATDIITKVCEEAFNWNFTVIPNLISVESGHRNSGAAFSFLADAAWGQTFLIVVTFVMLIVLIGAFLFLPERFVLLKLAVAMLIAGAVGNLIDRIAFGNVRDFVWVNMLGKWACCNFADFWIVFAVVIAVIDLLFLNEWAVLPLTKKAKQAQAAKKEQTAQEQIVQEQNNQTSIDKENNCNDNISVKEENNDN